MFPGPTRRHAALTLLTACPPPSPLRAPRFAPRPATYATAWEFISRNYPSSWLAQGDDAFFAPLRAQLEDPDWAGTFLFPKWVRVWFGWWHGGGGDVKGFIVS